MAAPSRGAAATSDSESENPAKRAALSAPTNEPEREGDLVAMPPRMLDTTDATVVPDPDGIGAHTYRILLFPAQPDRNLAHLFQGACLEFYVHSSTGENAAVIVALASYVDTFFFQLRDYEEPRPGDPAPHVSRETNAHEELRPFRAELQIGMCVLHSIDRSTGFVCTYLPESVTGLAEKNTLPFCCDRTRLATVAVPRETVENIITIPYINEFNGALTCFDPTYPTSIPSGCPNCGPRTRSEYRHASVSLLFPHLYERDVRGRFIRKTQYRAAKTVLSNFLPRLRHARANLWKYHGMMQPVLKSFYDAAHPKW